MSNETLEKTVPQNVSLKRLTAARTIRKVMCGGLQHQNNDFDKKSKSLYHQELQPSRHVHFDFVGNGTDPRTRHEMSALTQQLLEQRKNCCLQRFCNKRHCAMFFLYQLLVRNVDRRLQMMQCKLTHISLQYYDLRQHPVTGHFFHLLRSDVSFNTMQQLFKWLDCEYRRLFGAGQWHEVIEIKYEFEDQRYVVHPVTLVILQLYLLKLDANSKRSLCRLLRTSTHPVGKPLKSAVAEERGMVINDCIRAHFGGMEPWWIVFDVSQESGQITGDTLKLAHSAYKGLKEENRRLFMAGSNVGADAGVRLRGGGMQRKNSCSKKPSKVRTTLQRKIDTWIERFEKNFANIYEALKLYYDCRYAEGIAQLCQNVCRKSNQMHAESDSRTSDMQHYFNRYKLAQVSLENLLRELEFCEYRNKLVPYLRRKAKELNDNATKYKVSKLKSCQTQLADAIMEEIMAIRA